MRKQLFFLPVLGLAGCLAQPIDPSPDSVWLSVVGTNDVHGELVGRFGGLGAFSGYVSALRERRQSDGGTLLLDAGDMWQGTLESNLSEGAYVVEAYNALGYDAAAVGNHEFDFGPAGEAFIPEGSGDDPRGALKARAREANFPLLAANVIDTTTGRAVAWDNVQPSVMLERAGVRVGIVGVTTADTLTTTILANTVGLAIAPLALTVEREARLLRERGADLVIVVAHAGGHCEQFNEPQNTSSCDDDAEIFEVARALPKGLVNQIIAGHQHRGIAHVVNDIAITASFSNARAFGRVDYRIDLVSRKVAQRIVFPPQRICAYVSSHSERCAVATDPHASAATYEYRPVVPMSSVATVVKAAAEQADVVKEQSLGVILDSPITTRNQPFSAIGRLMTDAIRQGAGTDIAIHNVVGGLRDSLPAGKLTFGDVYRVFPFDNRMAVIRLTGAQLKHLLANQVHNTERRAGVSGIRVNVSCVDDQMAIELRHLDGRVIEDDDSLSVAANDFLLLGGDGIFTPVTPEGGFRLDHSQPRVRDVWVAWFRARGGHLDAQTWLTPDQLRWHLPDPLPTDCKFRE